MVSDQPESPHRILVVDDDEVMRELLSALLELQGYEVAVAASGEDGVALLRSPNPPEMILTDLQMPGLEGEALTAALRAAAAPGAILIGMSGSRPSPATLRSVDGFLAKPFATEQLLAAFITAREARTESATPMDARSHAADPENTISVAQGVGETTEVLDGVIFSALLQSFRPEHLRELYGMTLKDVEQRYASMQEFAASGDLSAAQREAHAVKGACGFVGARQLQAIAASMEGGTTLNTSALAEFPAACARLRRMLDAKLQQ